MADLDRLRLIAACGFTFTEPSLLLADRQSQEASQETNAYWPCFMAESELYGWVTA